MFPIKQMAKLLTVMNCESNAALNISLCLRVKFKAISDLPSQTLCPLDKLGS